MANTDKDLELNDKILEKVEGGSEDSYGKNAPRHYKCPKCKRYNADLDMAGPEYWHYLCRDCGNEFEIRRTDI